MENQLIKKSFSVLFLFSLIETSIGCSNQPLLSNITNTRLTLILKGTYESNGTVNQQSSLLNNKYSSLGGAASNNSDSSNYKIYLDIADIRLGNGNGPGKNPAKYWQYLSNPRQVLCPDVSSLTGYPLTYCNSDNGVGKHKAFFDGSGVKLEAADVKSGSYNHLAIYIRKFVSSPSFTYNSTGTKLEQNKVLFDGQEIYGKNSGLQYMFSKADDSSSRQGRLVPLEDKSLSINIPEGDQPFVLEVRMLVNGLLMKHLVKESNGDYTSFIGPSDWSQKSYDSSGKLGGNFVITARAYQPGKTGSITGSGFLAVMPAGKQFEGKMLPIAASRDGTITNLAPGSYDIYKVIDDSDDGFPKANSTPCASNVQVTAGSSVTASGC